VRYELRILMIADADTSQPLGPPVYVKSVTLLFDVLTRAGGDALGDGAREHGKEFADGRPLKEAEGAQFRDGDELVCGLGVVADYLSDVSSEGRREGKGVKGETRKDVRRCSRASWWYVDRGGWFGVWTEQKRIAN